MRQVEEEDGVGDASQAVEGKEQRQLAQLRIEDILLLLLLLKEGRQKVKDDLVGVRQLGVEEKGVWRRKKVGGGRLVKKGKNLCATAI